LGSKTDAQDTEFRVTTRINLPFKEYITVS